MKKIGMFLLAVIVCSILLVVCVSHTLADTGGTLHLDGSGYVRVHDEPALNPTQEVTLEAWVYQSDPTNCGTIIGKNFNNTFWLGTCPSKLRFYTAGQMFESTHPITPSTWTHVAVSLGVESLGFYINGVLDSFHTPPQVFPTNSEDWVIGADYDGDYRWIGELAGVRIWDRALNQSEIRDNMFRQLDEPEDGLIADWELVGSAEEMFGRYVSTSTTTGVVFTGTVPSAYIDSPIDIPTLPSAPTVNGICAPGEYGTLKVPIWVLEEVSWTDQLVWAYVAATAGSSGSLYVCIDGFPGGSTNAQVYVDTQGNAGSAPQSDDYRVRAIKDSASASERGNGSTWVTPGLTDYQAVFTTSDILSYAEFRIPRSIFPSLTSTFGLQIMLSGGIQDYGWPLSFDANFPSGWERVRISGATLRADSANPHVIFLYTIPRQPPAAGQTMAIFTQASDDVDIAQIDIYVDGSASVHTCTYPGTGDIQASCTYTNTSGYNLGSHAYFSRVTDHRGRIGDSSRQTFFIRATGDSPKIQVQHAPIQAAIGGTVTITATVTDAEGIQWMNIMADLLPTAVNLCNFSPGTSPATCTLTITPPTTRRVVYYYIRARDYEGLESVSARIPILFGNTGTDEDADGLSDEIERILGTSPKFNDTDQDTLLDGYEVLGIYFPSDATHPTDYINLPAMGANPTFRDLFVQYDYERGVRVLQRSIDYAIGLFRSHNIALHITENERPRPGASNISNVTAEGASYTTTVGGDYYFDPILNWTHQYIYGRHHGDASYWQWRYYVTLNMDTHGTCDINDPNPAANCPRDTAADTYGFVHELGHHIGLGHGGRTGTYYRQQYTEAGGFIHYGNQNDNFDGINFKPNYLSVMNYYGETMYKASLMCYNQSTNYWLGDIGFLNQTMPTLNEASLDEQPTSAFATALRTRSCNNQPDYVPVAVYYCHPASDTLHRAMVRITDGYHTLAWTWAGSRLNAITGHMHDHGIDWNCDNTISNDPVSEDLNNDSIDGQMMVANADWSQMPAGGRDCPIGGDAGNYMQPADYRNLIRGKDCGSGGVINPLPTTPPIGTSFPSMMAANSSSIKTEGAGIPASPISNTDLDDTKAYGECDIDFPFNTPENFELCDGIDNDNDGEIDEDCADSDSDGVINTLDNCPQTYNPTQLDNDGDLLGDACQNPTVTNLAGTINGDGSVSLTWSGSTTDILGFNVYHVEQDGTQVYLGGDHPSTTDFYFNDKPDPAVAYIYAVWAVNLNGIEGGEARLIISESPLYLPLVLR